MHPVTQSHSSRNSSCSNKSVLLSLSIIIVREREMKNVFTVYTLEEIEEKEEEREGVEETEFIWNYT